ncbi:hypothetical protein Q5530_17185 [Saccharothrix sp. BKS2]|uniref:hypothetical protein n=1 Tax=Saccharothrix sp. BKS2 TaxID=3064400 RepID=UPI0039EC928A
MVEGEGVTARQASFGGRGARLLLRWCAVSCWLVVPIPAVVLFTTDVPWWAGVPIQALVLLLILPIGIALWFDADQHREDTGRLLRAGRPAVAEVVELELVDPGDGSADTAVLRLRISGDDVPPFEATYRGSADPEFRPGALLHATVDPADNLFVLRNLHRS